MEEAKELYSSGTEKSILGCMFLDRAAAEMGRNTLKAEDFYIPTYRAIFEAMQAVEVIDIMTVWNELQRRGEGERISVDMLRDIFLFVSSSINIKAHVEDLQRLSYYRRSKGRTQVLMQAVLKQDDDEIARILAEQQADSWGGGEIKTVLDAFHERMEKLERIRKSGNRLLGISTGFADLDGGLGGLQDGALIILAGRPSMGKTALALDIARGAAKALTEEKDRAAIFSMEMPDDVIAQRIYTAECMVSNNQFFANKSYEEWKETSREAEENRNRFEKVMERLLIDDRSGMTIERMRGQCHKWKSNGYHLKLIVVDYLQLMQGKGENRTREIGEISRGLKRLAKDFDCPVLALSQLSRKCEDRADCRPMLSDLRESGDIEQDADVVLLLWREEYYFPDCDESKKGQVEVNIAKQREGPTGTIYLRWFADKTTFRDFVHFTPTKEAPPKEWVQEHL